MKVFTNKVQEAIEKRKTSNHQVSNNNEIDPYEKLEKLASLKEKGVITEEEFLAEKRLILAA